MRKLLRKVSNVSCTLINLNNKRETQYLASLFRYELMKRTIIITLITLWCSTKSIAGVVDHDVMYKAYLDNKIATWGIELKKYTASQQLSADDKLEISNYLYGYIAFLLIDIENNKSEINKWIDLWDEYLDEIEKAKGKRADVFAYRSANNAYKAKVRTGGVMIYGARSLNDLNRAMNCDANNIVAIELKGNTKFYMPSLVGGDKKEAIEWFEKALKIIDANPTPLYRWNRCAITLCMAQSYEKIGDKQKAIEICKKELLREPNFTYLRDVYLPSLQK